MGRGISGTFALVVDRMVDNEAVRSEGVRDGSGRSRPPLVEGPLPSSSSRGIGGE